MSIAAAWFASTLRNLTLQKMAGYYTNAGQRDAWCWTDRPTRVEQIAPEASSMESFEAARAASGNTASGASGARSDPYRPDVETHPLERQSRGSLGQ